MAPASTLTLCSHPAWLHPRTRGCARRCPLAAQSLSSHKAHKGSVPFLLKVLSVRTALSIQAHPDKALAQELHAKRADLYKDDNHKPEMAIAITPFEALCSFQRVTSIVANCAACPELVELIGEDSVGALDQAATCEDDAKPALRQLYSRLMTAAPHVVAQKLTNLISRIHATVEMLRAPVDTLALRIHEQYPGDVGVFCVYLMNYICLKPGEALFMAANEPHAYLFGDCVECMACSDNVVRAGLTPKFKDTNTLCDMVRRGRGARRGVGSGRAARRLALAASAGLLRPRAAALPLAGPRA